MEQGNKQKRINIRLIMIIITLCYAVAYLVGAIYTGMKETGYAHTTGIAIEENWSNKKGESFYITNIPRGNQTLTRDLSGVSIGRNSLCFISQDCFFDVSVAGKTVYKYHPEIPVMMGSSYGMAVHTVPLPEGSRSVTLKLEPIFPDRAARINDIRIDNSASYTTIMFRQGSLGFGICMLMLILGFVAIAIGMLGQNSELFVPLGAMAILVSTWSVNDTLVLQMITGNSSIIRVFNYVSLMLIPYAPVSFLSKLTNNKNELPLNILAAMVMLNVCLSVSLAATGFMDYHYTLIASQVMILIAFGIAIYIIISALKKKRINKSLMTTILVSFPFAFAGGAIDMARYYIMPNIVRRTGLFTRIGIILFLLIFTIYVIKEYSRLKIETGKAQVMSELAYTDALTGLLNRQALNETESQIKGMMDSCYVIQLDVNELKTVNDVHGHKEGDRHLKAAAGIILDSFVNLGTCFRTGGDEFMVVTGVGVDEEAIKKALQKMEILEKEYNVYEKPPVPLMIASGYAFCADPHNDLDAIEVEADNRMYEKKKQMKAERAKKVGS